MTADPSGVHVIETAQEMRAARCAMRKPVGFVATMGALHDGHVALVTRALAECSTVVASLFVNPTQFAPGEDFETYPRDRAHDVKIFVGSGANVVFAPTVEEMYPPGDTTSVDPGQIGDLLEGKYRPGHFRGVATIVTKLFTVVRPDVAYFGEKDAQQLRIVRRLNDSLRSGATIVEVPTVRADDGLALSSRNVYLSPGERKEASVLYRGLRAAEALWRSGERSSAALKSAVVSTFASAPGATLEYVSVADSDTLREVETSDPPVLVSLAARAGHTRLIDSMTLPRGVSAAGTGRG